MELKTAADSGYTSYGMGHNSSWADTVLPIAQLGTAITVAALNRNRNTLNPAPGTTNPNTTPRANAFPWAAVGIAVGVGAAFFVLGRMI